MEECELSTPAIEESDTFRDDNLNDNRQSTNDVKEEKWKTVQFGLIHTILSKLFKNVSYRVCGILTILTQVTISISDTISDFAIAITLFSRKHTTLGWAVIIIDYVPGWILAIHNSFSLKWRSAETINQKVLTTAFLIFSPFSQALFHIRWLCRFDKAGPKEFELLHHNSRLSQLLCGSYESPMQIMLLFIVWGQNKIDLPWSNETCLKDSQNRTVCLGVIPGILSLAISLLSLLKGSIELSEGQSWTEKGITFVYSFCNFAFRLPSIALLILYFNEWSLMIFIPIMVANLIMILRFDTDKRQDLSIVSSVIISTVTPFVASDQTNLYQRTESQIASVDTSSDNTYRRKLASNISMAISPMLFTGDLVLFFLLRFHKTFDYNDEIILEENVTEKILSMFLLPLGGLVMVANLMYRQRLTPWKSSNKSTNGDDERDTPRLKRNLKALIYPACFIALFLGTLALSGIMIHSVLNGKGKYIHGFYCIMYFGLNNAHYEA